MRTDAKDETKSESKAVQALKKSNLKDVAPDLYRHILGILKAATE